MSVDQSYGMLSNLNEKAKSNVGSLSDVLDFAWECNKATLRTMIPVKVIELANRTKRMVRVQPLARWVSEAGFGAQAKLGPFSVSTWQFAANGFVVDLPIRVGDTGWVVASDFECQGVRDTHGVSDIATISTHILSQGIFVPDYYGVLMDKERKHELNPYQGEDNRLVISSFDGKQKVSIGRAQQQGEDIGNTTGDIRVESYTDAQHKTTIVIKNGVVTVDTTDKVDVSAGNTVNVTAGQSANVKSPIVTMAGVAGDTAVSITGTLTVSGLITANGDVKNSAGTSFTSHTHKENGVEGTPDSQAPTVGS